MVEHPRNTVHVGQRGQHPTLVAQPRPYVPGVVLFVHQRPSLLDDQRGAVPLVHGAIHVSAPRLEKPGSDPVVIAQNRRTGQVLGGRAGKGVGLPAGLPIVHGGQAAEFLAVRPVDDGQQAAVRSRLPGPRERSVPVIDRSQRIHLPVAENPRAWPAAQEIRQPQAQVAYAGPLWVNGECLTHRGRRGVPVIHCPQHRG